MEDKQSSTYSELVDIVKSVMDSYKATDEEIRNLEEATQLQSKCRLWSIHRAGKITASKILNLLFGLILTSQLFL